MIVAFLILLAAFLVQWNATRIRKRQADYLAADNRYLRQQNDAALKAVYQSEIAVRAAHRQLNAISPGGYVKLFEPKSKSMPPEIWPETIEER